jgi:hypothetical protein
MSTDNIVPIRSGGQPPSPPAKSRKPRTAPEDKVALRFARGSGVSPSKAWMGLRGVIWALERLDGGQKDLDDYVTLSVAASVFAEILLDLELTMR